MRIAIAGNWQYDIYERACADALVRLGHDVVAFAWLKYFSGRLGKAQHFLPLPGPSLMKLNQDLRSFVKANRPDVLWLWRATHVLPWTLKKVREQNHVSIVSYNNDDPFGPMYHDLAPWHHRFKWFWHVKCLKWTDLALVYRPANYSDALVAGARRAYVAMPYYVPAMDFPRALTAEQQAKFGCDVVFVGHYEPDGREHAIRALVGAGLHVRLFGDRSWSPKILGDMAKYFGGVRRVVGSEYRQALCGAKMCLAFLSKLNRDVYTRRCFEIPACGRLLLCERTEELQKLFIDDQEAVFFSSPAELVRKALWLRDNQDVIQRIADAGLRQVQMSRHSVDDRMREWVEVIQRAKENRQK